MNLPIADLSRETGEMSREMGEAEVLERVVHCTAVFRAFREEK